MSKKNKAINKRIAELVQNFLDEGIEPEELAQIFATHAVQINLMHFDVNSSNCISNQNFKELFLNIFQGFGNPFFLKIKDNIDQKCANDNQKLIKSAIVKSKNIH